jgi:hypothetical protein
MKCDGTFPCSRCTERDKRLLLRACDNCRRQKMKCNDIFPCRRCKLLKRTCTNNDASNEKEVRACKFREDLSSPLHDSRSSDDYRLGLELLSNQSEELTDAMAVLGTDSPANMTVPLPCQPTTSAACDAAPRKRRRRAPASGAADDCFACHKRNAKCDRRRPYCSPCLEIGNDCSGYKTQLTWGVGVASRGKLRGLSLPVAKSAPAVKSPPTRTYTRPRATSSLNRLAVEGHTGDDDIEIKIEREVPRLASAYTSYDFMHMNPNPKSPNLLHSEKEAVSSLEPYPTALSATIPTTPKNNTSQTPTSKVRRTLHVTISKAFANTYRTQ